MRTLTVFSLAMLLTACSISGDGDNNDNLYSCSAADQKRFVRDATLDWYLWNDLLPDKVKISDYDNPAELLADLVRVQPLDSYSYIGSAAADAAFFGAGQYLGFGFSWREVAAGDLRLTRVFSSSPAASAGLSRGQRIVALDGRTIAEIEAAEGIGVALNAGTLDFTMREIDGMTEFTTAISQDLVTIDPVPQWRTIDRPGNTPVGYVELASFIGTADATLDAVFANFRAAGVTDLIVDLRYNGGGLVSTAEYFADLMGGIVAENLTFTRTLFNADRSANNDSEEFFERLANSISLSRLVVIATPSTASSSELLTNGMEPHVDVTIIGERTFGKPVGQLGFQFCGSVLRLTGFQTVNADGFGDYFGGLPADCPVADDLGIPVGDAADPNLVAAQTYLDTGACPAPPAMTVQSAKPGTDRATNDKRQQPPWREFAGAW